MPAFATVRHDLRKGARDISPTLLGSGPYGLVMGIAAAEAGLTLTQATGMSAAIFAGVSQLVAVDLIARHTSVWVIILTGLIINARFVMYSASIAPHLMHLSRLWRWACPFFLIGPVYAICLGSFDRDNPAHNGWYLLGAAVPSWTVWILGTIVGMLVGVQIPDGLQLDFIVPLVFIAITMNFVEDRASFAAMLVGGTTALLAAGFPLNLGILVAGALGIIAGVLTQEVTP